MACFWSQGTTDDGSSKWTMFLLQSVVALIQVKHKQSLKNDLKQQPSFLARGSVSTECVTVQLHHTGAQIHQSKLVECALSQSAHSAAFIYAPTVQQSLKLISQYAKSKIRTKPQVHALHIAGLKKRKIMPTKLAVLVKTPFHGVKEKSSFHGGTF